MILANISSVLVNILYVIIAIVVLLTMVLIHEFGHYIVGRILGFTITEFSVGFGKAILQRKNKRGELISLRIFPLGGYCAFLGEGDAGDSNENADDSENNNLSKNSQSEQIETLSQEKKVMFNDQKPWKRLLVFVAGVTFNFISAFIFAIIFLSVASFDGYSISPSSGYSVNVYSVSTNEIVGTLDNNTTVCAVNGVRINYAREKTFPALVNNNDDRINLTIIVDGENQDVYIKKENVKTVVVDGENVDEYIFGIDMTTKRINYNFGNVLADFAPFTLRISVLIVNAFGMIITGKIALNQLGGPISTITQISQVASLGIANFLYLLPLLAANLAIFNILPIPGLDGSHVVFTTIEWIRGKPIKREIENAIHTWGIIVLFAFVIIIDLVHMITA